LPHRKGKRDRENGKKGGGTNVEGGGEPLVPLVKKKGKKRIKILEGNPVVASSGKRGPVWGEKGGRGASQRLGRGNDCPRWM